MAVKASSSITLSSVVDVKAVYRYYLLQSSTLAKPTKPTTYPPTGAWNDTEPTYTSGSTNSLYFIDCTVFCDDTFSYSTVSLSSSYEAAKAAYNKATNAENSATNANNKIDNLEIGGRNLFEKSRNLSMLDHMGTYSCPSYSVSYGSDMSVPSNQYMMMEMTVDSTTTYNGGPYFSGINSKLAKHISKMIPGEIYTISVWAKCSTAKTVGIMASEFLTNITTSTLPKLSTEWQKYVLTGTYNGNVSSAVAITFYYGSHWVDGDIFYLSSPKIEKGNKATDWTPAPEDLETKVENIITRVTVAETEIVKNNGLIGLMATREDVTESLGNYYTKTEMDANFEVQADNITSSVRSTYATITDLNTVSSAAANAQSSADSAQAAIDNLEIGGRNFLRNADFSNSTTNWSGANSTTISIDEIDGKKCLAVDSSTSTSATYGYATQRVTLELNSKYTISAKIYTSVDAKIQLAVWYDNSGWKAIGSTTLTLTAGWNDVLHTFTTNETYPVTIIGFDPVKSYNTIMYIYHPQVEKGTVVTDWALAAEDIYSPLQIGATNLIRNSAEMSGNGDNWRWDNITSTGRTREPLDDSGDIYKVTIEASGLTTNGNYAIIYRHGSATYQTVNVGETYTASVWYYADSSKSAFSVASGTNWVAFPIRERNASGTAITSTAIYLTASTIVYDKWTRLTVTHTVSNSDVVYISVDPTLIGNGNIAFTKPKLETGNKATDWTRAPGDVDGEISDAMTTANAAQEVAAANAEEISIVQSTIQQLADSISLLVVDSNGASLMTQTENGWTFSTSKIQNAVDSISEALDIVTNKLDDTDAAIQVLQQAKTEFEAISEYVNIGIYEDEPCIELGEGDSEFKLRITNTRILFMDGSDVPAYITNKSFHIKQGVIEEELQQGGFIWKVRSNGNMGLMWKGVTE